MRTPFSRAGPVVAELGQSGRTARSITWLPSRSSSKPQVIEAPRVTHPRFEASAARASGVPLRPRVSRVGDKVMQPAQQLDKGTAGVFNGSVGVVTGLSLEEQELRVVLDEDEEVGYGFDELDELTHAYAVSIHRSQGSEYPCVVIPLMMSAWLMLRRNLVYTAVTRAKRIVVLVGSKRALARAVRTQGAGRRYTALTERLRA
jgi:exodeoxyribonuclease V alpha subunit